MVELLIKAGAEIVNATPGSAVSIAQRDSKSEFRNSRTPLVCGFVLIGRSTE